MGLRRILVPGLVALLVAAPVVAQAPSTSDFYPYRGYCGLAAVSIRLFGYGETVQIGASLSGAPASYVASFIAWCGSRGVGDTPETELAGTCRFDSECSPICEGPVFWKRGCNNVYEGGRIVRKECQKTFETNCAATSATAGSYSFPNTCNPSAPACVKDAAAIRAKLAELEQQRDKLKSDLATLEAQNQRLTSVQKKAASACLSGAADVTNKLIVDTALLASGFKAEAAVADAISRFYGVVVADTTGKVIDEVAKQTGTTSVPTDTQQEFWQNMCVLEKSIRETDMPLWNRKFLDVKAKADTLIADVQALNALLG